MIQIYNQMPQKPPLGSQVDWGNSITKGLKILYLFNEGGGNRLSNLATPGYLDGTIVEPYWEPQRYGLAMRFYGTAAANNLVTTYSKASFDEMTIIIRTCPVTVGNSKVLWSGGTGKAKIETFSSAYDYIGGGFDIYPTGYYVAGRWAFVGATLKSATAAQLFCDGRLTGSDSSITTNSLDAFAFGYPNTCYIDYIAVFERVLSAIDMMRLYLNPNQLVLPSLPYWMYPQPAAGGVIVDGQTAATVDGQIPAGVY